MADLRSSSGHLADKVASLRATAEALTHEDATRSGHCQGLSRSIEQDYEEQLAAGSASDAQDYLLAAHAVFRAKGLQTACRIVLGKLARLANEHNLREGLIGQPSRSSRRTLSCRSSMTQLTARICWALSWNVGWLLVRFSLVTAPCFRSLPI